MTCRQIRQGLIHLFGSAADEEDPAQPKRLHVGRPGTVGPSLLAPGVPHRSSPPKTQNRIGNNRGGSLIRCPARTPPRLSFFSFHSAMCWFFGRDVFNALQSPRPIGLIETNVGGTPDQHCERKGPRSPPPIWNSTPLDSCPDSQYIAGLSGSSPDAIDACKGPEKWDWCGTPQNGLSSNKMALITSDCGTMRSPSIK